MWTTINKSLFQIEDTEIYAADSVYERGEVAAEYKR